MSCGRPVEEEDIPTAPAPSSVCAKCKQPAVVQSQRTAYCNDCFLSAFAFKTKKGFDPARQASRYGSQSWQKLNQGKSRGVLRDSVLLCFSGGPNSRAMLEVCKAFSPVEESAEVLAKKKYNPPPIFKAIEVVYVDQSEVEGYGADRSDEVQRIVASTGWTLHIVKLSQLFADNTQQLSLNTSTSNLTTHPTTTSASSLSPVDQLRALLAPLPSTSRASLLSSLLNTLLHRTAHDLGHQIVITGESSTRLAINTIASMSLGRGYSMGEETGWEAEDERGVLRVRPMRAVVDAEIAYYNKQLALESLEMKLPRDGVEPKKAGIEAVCEEFINNLEANFSSTVPVVLRTAQKLGLRTNHSRLQPEPTSVPCPLCGSPAQAGADGWRSAITISSLALSETSDPAVIAAAAASDETAPGVVEEASGEERSQSEKDGRALAPLLCYGCLLVWQGAQQGKKGPRMEEEQAEVVLPGYVRQAAEKRWGESDEVVGERRVGVNELRGEVESFLL